MKFVMVPAESLRTGDVVAVDNTPTKYAQPLAEVNVTSDYVELVFFEKSLYSERTIRAQAQSLYSKAGLSGRASLSAFFLEDLLAPIEKPE